MSTSTPSDRPDDEDTGPPRDAPSDPGSTFHHVAAAAGSASSPSWNQISNKVEVFLHVRFRNRRLPVGVEFDDLFVEVMAQIFRDLKHFQVAEGASFWGWVKTLADHKLTDIWRRHTAQKRGGGHSPVPQSEDDDADPLDRIAHPTDPTPSQVAHGAELEQAEQRFVETLREEAQRVYILRRVDGLSFEEIARAVGRNKAVTVRSIYKRARDHVHACFRKKLDEFGSTWEGWR